MWAKKQSEVFCFLSVALVRVGCSPWPTGSDSWQTAFSSWSSFFIFIEADSSLLQDYVWHHIETVSFSRTLKLCFCMQFSWNQRLSSNIYWLSDKGLWRFRDSQFLLTCFKRKVVSTQFLDSSQYFFFLNTGVNALLYHSSGHTKQNSHLMVTPIFKIKFKFLSMVWRYLRKGILLDPALVFIWTLSLLMSHPTEWFIILFHAVDLSVACFSFCLLTLFSFFHL